VRSPAAIALPFFLALAGPAAAQTVSPATPIASAPARKPPLFAAMLCGVGTALIPLALGATYTATAHTDAGRNLGLQVAGVGPALAPIAGHLALGEWTRAAAFGAAPVLGEIGMVTYMHLKPQATFHGGDGDLAIFATFFLLDLLGATVGLTDVALVDERVKQPRITLAPLASGGRFGIAIGGSL
jgi:hypothetical protein